MNMDIVRAEIRQRIRVYNQLIERHSPKDDRDPAPQVLMWKEGRTALHQLAIAVGIQL